MAAAPKLIASKVLIAFSLIPAVSCRTVIKALTEAPIQEQGSNKVE